MYSTGQKTSLQAINNTISTRSSNRTLEAVEMQEKQPKSPDKMARTHSNYEQFWKFFFFKQGKRRGTSYALSPPNKPDFEQSDVHKVAPD